MDWFHKLTDLLSYNRYTALAAMLAVVAIIPACWDPTGTSPVTGAATSALVLGKEEAEVKIKLKAELDKAVKTKEAAANALQVEFTQRVAQINDTFDAIVIDTEAKAKVMEEGFKAANAQIDAKVQSIQTWVDISNQIVGMVAPGIAPIWATGATLLVAGLGLDNRRKDKKIAAAPTT